MSIKQKTRRQKKEDRHKNIKMEYKTKIKTVKVVNNR